MSEQKENSELETPGKVAGENSNPEEVDYRMARDVSWLSFNHRVLQEAADPRVPLYERIKFLAIYSSNLDEFFRVRVAALRSFGKLRKKTRRKLDLKPRRTLRKVLETVGQQQKQLGSIWREQILPELAGSDVHLLTPEQLQRDHAGFVRSWFEENLKGKVDTHRADVGSAPFLENRSLYFVYRLKDGFGIADIPSHSVQRFVVVPMEKGHGIAYMDDFVRLNLPRIVGHDYAGEAWSFKLSRDAEMYIDDEFSGDLVEKIRQGLSEREEGLPTRFLHDENMPQDLLEQLMEWLSLSEEDVVAGARYHNFHDLFGFPDPLGKSDWKDAELPPSPHPELEEAESLFDGIAAKDHILHFPYQSFDYIPRLLNEAADDPMVKCIKITLYRVAGDSAVAKALIRAAERGIEVTAFLEIKARFDEASNLQWGAALEQAGVRVIYSYPGIKVHTKLFVISRQEGDEERLYAYLGTGNFNEKTARLYCDHALLTADPKLTEEALQVFEVLERKRIITKTKHLLVSPFSLRAGFTKLIRKEANRARQGKPASILAKMNSLEDPEMIDELVEAAEAGVKIQLIVRGICCLNTEAGNLPENLSVISLVDRFLEHARVYVFGIGKKRKMFIASADWMTRNLDRRIELGVPIYDEGVFAEIMQILELQLTDNVKARMMDAAQSNPYVENEEEPLRAQVATWELLAQNQDQPSLVNK